jgi:hypothetical protein
MPGGPQAYWSIKAFDLASEEPWDGADMPPEWEPFAIVLQGAAAVVICKQYHATTDAAVEDPDNQNERT